MSGRDIKSLFPNTVNAKKVIAPYNDKSKKRKEREGNLESDASLVKGQTSFTSVKLKDLNDFSSSNEELHVLLLEAGETLKNSTNGDYVSVYMVDRKRNEIYLLTGDERDINDPQYRFEIKKGTTVAAHVALQRENVMVESLDMDSRFLEGIGFHNQHAESVLSVPVVTQEGDCYAIFELVKKDDKDPFSKDDLKVSVVTAGWMGAAIHQNLQRLAMLKQVALNSRLLKYTIAFFSGKSSCCRMVSDFMNYAKDNLGATKGTFYLIDKECEDLTAKVYEESLNERNLLFIKRNVDAKLLQKDRGIASLVARTGKTVNVKDSTRDRRIGNEYELRTGKTINTVLSVPIKINDEVCGIYHLLNKKEGFFTKGDESILKTFIRYTSCCLQYNHVKRRFKKAEIIYKLKKDCLKRLMRPCVHDYAYAQKNMNVKVANLQDFRWYLPEHVAPDSPQLAVFMMKDLCDDGNLNHDNLLRFMLSARRLYRRVPYHNFDHAFNFMHCMYNILRRNKDMFSVLEMKTLLISSIGHDIDHGGVTNNFLRETDDIIYNLYHESTWENYHFIVTSMLFDQFPIFNTSAKTYKVVMKDMKDAILATDLMRYFMNSKILIPLIRDNIFDTGKPEHRYLMKSIMMTVADLSGQCKPFAIARKLAENVYREFYGEGDQYKKRGLRALPLMDREKQNQIPQEQIQFLSFVVLPATRILESILSNIDLSRECIALQKSWQEVQVDWEKRRRNFIKD